MTRRVLTVVVVMTALAVIAFSIPALLAIRSAQQRGELLALQQEAVIVASRLTEVAPGDTAGLQAALETDHPLAIYLMNGQLVGGSGPTTPDHIVQLAIAGNFAEGYTHDALVAAIPVEATAAHPALVVRIEEPRSESQKRFLTSAGLLGLAGLAIIAVAACVGAWLSRRLNRPIDELTEWAEAGATDPPPPPTGIDELDSLRSALVDDRLRIDELLARERSFSSQVSHQLRTPVAAMRVAIEAEQAAPRPDSRLVLDESLGQLDRLESTITSLLALARHGAQPIVTCDVARLIERHVSQWNETAQLDDRHLSVVGAAVTATVDPEAIGHILDVLLDNAVVHGAGAIVVTVSRSPDLVWATIDVADEGPRPVSRDVFAEIGNDSSHGIGLRLARSLAESSGGSLSLLDTGTTTFRLNIPAR